MAKTFTLYWISKDRQSSMEVGSFPSRAAAEADIPAARAMLIDQCGSIEQIKSIEAGSIEVCVEDDAA